MLSCPWGTTERPLLIAKICRPNASLDRQPADVGEVDRQALGSLRREARPGGELVEVERLQQGGQVDAPVEPLERPLEFDVLRAGARARPRLMSSSSWNHSSTIGRTSAPSSRARPEALDQDERGQRLQGMTSEVAAGGLIRVPAAWRASEGRGHRAGLGGKVASTKRIVTGRTGQRLRSTASTAQCIIDDESALARAHHQPRSFSLLEAMAMAGFGRFKLTDALPGQSGPAAESTTQSDVPTALPGGKLKGKGKGKGKKGRGARGSAGLAAEQVREARASAQAKGAEPSVRDRMVDIGRGNQQAGRQRSSGK